MDSYTALELTINKVLSREEKDMVSKIEVVYNEANERLSLSKSVIESLYHKIIVDGRNQAEDKRRQIVGNSRLSARNKQLLLIEKVVGDVFEEAKAKIDSIRGDDKYALLMKNLLENALDVVNSEKVVVECNRKDSDLINKIVSELQEIVSTKIIVSEGVLDVIGGLKVKSKDGSMIYDATLDSRFERLRPLIRKDIAMIFVERETYDSKR